MKQSERVFRGEVELMPRRDSRKSFYGKARVRLYDNGDKVLVSYMTEVAKIRGNKPLVFGQWSQTTTRHIKGFLYQEGFEADNMKQILRDFGGNK